MIDQGWNERMLRDHLRTEDGYRNEAAETIVRRAYREVLGRNFPAMAAVQVVALMEARAKVEIEATAVIPDPTEQS
jgi:enamine deaminase RidA (YjgF/YER057c/UK114 family)